MLIEAVSTPTIISGTHGAIVRHLLPAMARCEGTRVASTPLSSEGGNYLLFVSRIISDLLSNVLRVHKLHRTLESKDGANAAHDVRYIHLFVNIFCQNIHSFRWGITRSSASAGTEDTL